MAAGDTGRKIKDFIAERFKTGTLYDTVVADVDKLREYKKAGLKSIKGISDAPPTAEYLVGKKLFLLLKQLKTASNLPWNMLWAWGQKRGNTI